MMTYSQYLFQCLQEECNEVGHLASKINRFGLVDAHKGTDPKGQPFVANATRIIGELNDFYAVTELIQEANLLPFFFVSDELIKAKKAKVKHYLEISRQAGLVE